MKNEIKKAVNVLVGDDLVINPDTKTEIEETVDNIDNGYIRCGAMAETVEKLQDAMDRGYVRVIRK